MGAKSGDIRLYFALDKKWLFQKRWIPLTDEEIEKHYFPKEDWIIYDVEIDELNS